LTRCYGNDQSISNDRGLCTRKNNRNNNKVYMNIIPQAQSDYGLYAHAIGLYRKATIKRYYASS